MMAKVASDTQEALRKTKEEIYGCSKRGVKLVCVREEDAED